MNGPRARAPRIRSVLGEHRCAPGHQQLVVQAALHAPPQGGLNTVGGPRERDGAIQAYAIGSGRLSVAVV